MTNEHNCQERSMPYSEQPNGACPDMVHIKDKIDNMAEQVERLTSLMERQIRLEEQAANHAAAVGRAFNQLGDLDKRVDALEKTETYVRGGVRYAGMAVIATIAILGWALKVQMDTVQSLPIRLDRIERQLGEMGMVEDRLAAEVATLKEHDRAAPR